MDFEPSNLEFGFWVLEFRFRLLQQANLALPQGEGPPRGNSRQFFVGAFWDVMGNPMNSTEKDCLIFCGSKKGLLGILGAVSFFWRDFGAVWILNLGI